MQSSVGRQGLTSTKLGLKSHWTVGVTWTELLSSRDHARRAERGPRGDAIFCCLRLQGEDSVDPQEISSELLVQEGGRLPPEHAPPGNRRESWQDEAIQGCSNHLFYFVAVLQASEQSAVDPLAEGEERSAEELW
ncbi:hypothetical protein NDU88_010068 [Pleurodeles waltl]|uniref:Uncharacterized protein n=1 Tax=Pleurodeles waltl TaxID=8319 RepID=A0AAV7QZ74_PLEWA|nr:hypothetical protein NDU88_010068 [Pleurodeles waltl]